MNNHHDDDGASDTPVLDVSCVPCVTFQSDLRERSEGSLPLAILSTERLWLLFVHEALECPLFWSITYALFAGRPLVWQDQLLILQPMESRGVYAKINISSRRGWSTQWVTSEDNTHYQWTNLMATHVRSYNNMSGLGKSTPDLPIVSLPLCPV